MLKLCGKTNGKRVTFIFKNVYPLNQPINSSEKNKNKPIYY